MANNLQILAYVQAMKDEVEVKIDIASNNDRINGATNVINTLKTYKQQLINLEKFIKGGN